MQLSEVYYRAVVSKDSRFDGLFFVGVKSTGIYCRPVCPARTPKRTGCLYFRHAAEAERDGFRACFRCRPERAPGHASIDSSSRLVKTAVAQIQAGFLNEGSVEALASSFGITGRHLRRVMKQELGVGPLELAQSRRLAMAKQLLQETSLGMTDVAFSSGFSSVRRFNKVFQERFDCTPSALRNNHPERAAPEDVITLQLDYRPPLPWVALVSHCRARRMEGIEQIEDNVYRRTAAWNEHQGWLSVSPTPGRPSLQVSLSLSLIKGVIPLLEKIRRKFDLDARPDAISAHLQEDPTLGPLVGATPGLRNTGAFDRFAQTIRIILGQRISVKAATTLCNRLVEALGTPLTTPFEALTRLFPNPHQLAACLPEQLTALGVQASRADTLIALSQAIARGQISLEQPPDKEQLASQLLAIKGIGPWTVEYMMMRLFGEPDVFPASDLELRKALNQCTTAEAKLRAESWRPWRTYAALYLWNRQPTEEK